MGANAFTVQKPRVAIQRVKPPVKLVPPPLPFLRAKPESSRGLVMPMWGNYSTGDYEK